MTRRPIPPPLALLPLALLAGCPLPQPLPEYPAGQTVTPPRIVADDNIAEHRVAYPQPIVEVPAGCANDPTYELWAYLRDSNIEETITGRWFVNYDARTVNSPSVVKQQEDQIPPLPTDATDQFLRRSGTFTFSPYARTPAAGTGGGSGATAGALYVVEYVVSNGFDPNNGNSDPDRPNRRPASSGDAKFEVQLYKWVFLTVPPSAQTPCPP